MGGFAAVATGLGQLGEDLAKAKLDYRSEKLAETDLRNKWVTQWLAHQLATRQQSFNEEQARRRSDLHAKQLSQQGNVVVGPAVRSPDGKYVQRLFNFNTKEYKDIELPGVPDTSPDAQYATYKFLAGQGFEDDVAKRLAFRQEPYVRQTSFDEFNQLEQDIANKNPALSRESLRKEALRQWGLLKWGGQIGAANIRATSRTRQFDEGKLPIAIRNWMKIDPDYEVFKLVDRYESQLVMWESAGLREQAAQIEAQIAPLRPRAEAVKQRAYAKVGQQYPGMAGQAGEAVSPEIETEVRKASAGKPNKIVAVRVAPGVIKKFTIRDSRVVPVQ